MIDKVALGQGSPEYFGLPCEFEVLSGSSLTPFNETEIKKYVPLVQKGLITLSITQPLDFIGPLEFQPEQNVMETASCNLSI
jgi:hypothetical protein